MTDGISEKRLALLSLIKNDFSRREEFLAASQILGLGNGEKKIVIEMKYTLLVSANDDGDQSMLEETLDGIIVRQSPGEDPWYLSVLLGSSHLIVLADAVWVDFIIDAVSAMAEALALDYRIGIGTPFDRPEYAAISYREAHEAILQCNSDHKISTYNAHSVQEREELKRLAQLTKEVIGAFESGRNEEVPSIVSNFFSKINGFEPDTALNLCIESINNILDYFGIDKFGQFKVKFRFDLIGPTEKEILNAIKATYLDNVVRIMELIKSTKGNPGEFMVKKVQEIVLANYSKQDLSLYEISKKLNFSYNYLSKMIKQKAGVSFVNYLTSVRMSNAKRLLLEGTMKIYEVATAVGYNSSGYFITAFCKYYGTSPSEFRESISGTAARQE